LLNTVNGLPDAPPEFAAVTEVPAVPPSAELDFAMPLIGVTGDDAADAGPVPTLFVAVTVKVYGVPFVRLVTIADVPVLVAVWPPDDVTV
jgi:hypothetical protein